VSNQGGGWRSGLGGSERLPGFLTNKGESGGDLTGDRTVREGGGAGGCRRLKDVSFRKTRGVKVFVYEGGEGR